MSSLRLLPVGEVHATATDALADLRSLEVLAYDAGAWQTVEPVGDGWQVHWTVPKDPVPLRRRAASASVIDIRRIS